MPLTIIGAGMAGLLAANMLHRHNPVIIEAQKSLPNNHSAVLRFRSPKVGDITGIEFKRVQMMKMALQWRNPVADMLAYSAKGSDGIMRSDRSLPAETVMEDRWIAPSNFIAQLAEGRKIIFGQPFDFAELLEGAFEGPVISTLPMPYLATFLNYPHFQAEAFNYVKGVNVVADVEGCDAYVSIYTPAPSDPFSRISLTGSKLIIEFPNFSKDALLMNPEQWLELATHILGFKMKRILRFEVKEQRYSKIQPIDNSDRKRFIAWATDHHNIFSLGRFGTWRPGLLLDDLVDDIKRIENWITGERYDLRFHR